MTSLGRRLQRIEATFRPVGAWRERHSAMQDLALQHLSGEQLDALRETIEHGKQSGQYPERESNAMKAITSAFEQEVQKAGYATVREFHRSCGIES
jgi:hypothetical protein